MPFFEDFVAFGAFFSLLFLFSQLSIASLIILIRTNKNKFSLLKSKVIQNSDSNNISQDYKIGQLITIIFLAISFYFSYHQGTFFLIFFSLIFVLSTLYWTKLNLKHIKEIEFVKSWAQLEFDSKIIQFFYFPWKLLAIFGILVLLSLVKYM